MEPQIINCFAAFRDGSLQRKFPLHSSSQAVPTAPNPLPSVLMNQTKPEMQRHNVYLFSQSTRVCLQLWEVNIKWCSWDEEADAVLGLKLSFFKAFWTGSPERTGSSPEEEGENEKGAGTDHNVYKVVKIVFLFNL